MATEPTSPAATANLALESRNPNPRVPPPDHPLVAGGDATTGGAPPALAPPHTRRCVRRILAAWAVLAAAAVAGAVLDAPSFPPTGGFRYPGVGIGALLALPFAARFLGNRVSLLAFGDEVPGSAAYEYVASRADVDPKRVAIVAYSAGG